MVIAVNSDDPDMVALVALTDLPQNLQLYMTDNAWTGTSFRTNEGTLRLTITEEDGIAAGTIFGYRYNDSGTTLLLHGNDWESVGGQFALAEAGDTIILYTTMTNDDEEIIIPVSAFSYSGKWKESGLTQDEYGTDSSALPASLVSVGAIAIPHNVTDNHYYKYVGSVQGDKAVLQMELQKESNWEGSNSNELSPILASTKFLVTGKETVSTSSAPIEIRRGCEWVVQTMIVLLSLHAAPYGT